MNFLATSITSEMLTPLTDSITSNVAVVLPVALTIFGTMIGIKLIPKLVGMFIR